MANSFAVKVSPMIEGNYLPEVYMLRRFDWQLFTTLTFKTEDVSNGAKLSWLFAWLREISKAASRHFKQIIWVARYELGSRTQRGHYHLCIAGMPLDATERLSCRLYEAFWRNRTGSIAKCLPYNPTRDGVGYMLKRSDYSDESDEEPILSDSLLEAVRRGPM